MRNFENEIWIDLKGNVHRWNGDGDIISAHAEIAHLILPNEEFAGDRLFEMGWIKCSKINGITASKEPNQKQIDALFDERGTIEVRILNDFIGRKVI